MERRQSHHSSERKRSSSGHDSTRSLSGASNPRTGKGRGRGRSAAAAGYDDYSSIVEAEEYESPVKMVICSSADSPAGRHRSGKKHASTSTRRISREIDESHCFEDVGQVLKSQLKGCLLLTSDLYDRECTEPQMYRGSDGEFFVSGRTADDQTQSVTTGYNDDLTEPPSIYNSVRTPRTETEELDNTTATMDPYWKAQVEHSMEITPENTTQDLLPPQSKENEGLQRGHLRRPRGTFNLEEERNKIDHNHLSTQPYDEDVHVPRGVVNQSPDLRDLRLRIFEVDQKNEKMLREDQKFKKDAIAVKYSRALEDLAGQDESIRLLKKELSQARAELEGVREQLRRNDTTDVTSSIPQQQQVAKIFQERINVEERLRKELTLNGKLMNRIAKLESETDRLTTELVETRESVEVRAWTPQRPTKRDLTTSSSTDSPGSSPSRASDLSNVKTELLNLRTEAAELRAGLAEAKAARLSAESARAEIERTNEEKSKEAEQLKSRLDDVSCKFNESKRNVDTAAEEEEEGETGTLREELESTRLQLERSNNEVSELKSENQSMVQLRLELVESQAACLAAEEAKALVEKERDEARNDAKLLQSKLDKMLGELTELKYREESSERERSEKISHLREELSRMRSDFESAKSAKDDQLKMQQTLEESLFQAQDELSKLRSNLADAEHEVRTTKEKADERVRISDKKVERLEKELESVKEELSRARGEIIQQAANHLQEKKKLEENLEKSHQAAETIQHRLVAMDDRIALAEATENQLREQVEEEERRSDASSTLRRLSGDVFERLKKRLDSLEK